MVVLLVVLLVLLLILQVVQACNQDEERERFHQNLEYVFAFLLRLSHILILLKRQPFDQTVRGLGMDFDCSNENREWIRYDTLLKARKVCLGYHLHQKQCLLYHDFERLSVTNAMTHVG